MAIPPSGVVTHSRTASDSSRLGRSPCFASHSGNRRLYRDCYAGGEFSAAVGAVPQSGAQGQSLMNFLDATAHRDEIPDVQPAIL